MLDAKKVWTLRNKYATLRPTGWRSEPGSAVPARRELCLVAVVSAIWRLPHPDSARSRPLVAYPQPFCN